MARRFICCVVIAALVSASHGDENAFKQINNEAASDGFLDVPSGTFLRQVAHESDRFWNRYLQDSESLSLKVPTRRPTTAKQTRAPTKRPTAKATTKPTKQPTKKPTGRPTKQPTKRPTGDPTKQPQTPTPLPVTIADVVVREEDLIILESALQAGLLLSALADDVALTLFAPTDSAFEQSDLEYVTTLLEPQWILHLRNLLLFHVTDSGVFASTSFRDGQLIPMLNGENAVATVERRGPEGILDIFIDTSMVSTADIFATNGLVHKIDAVRFPAFFDIDILDYLDQTPELSILAELVRLADLDGEASGVQPLTLFAPSNEAFGKLPGNTLFSLRDPANLDLLRNVLLYHLVNDAQPLIGDRFGFFDTEPLALTSLFGPTLQVSFANNSASVNQNTNVETPDVLVRNGIVHRVNAVLRPAAASPVPIPPANPPVAVPSPVAAPVTVPAPAVPSSPAPITTGTAAPAFTSTSEPSSLQTTILDLVLADTDLSELSRALVTAQIANIFATLGASFTVFAPVNNAFLTLPADDLAKFFTPKWELHLQNLLLFHASSDSPDALADGTTLEMLNGETVTVNIDASSGEIALSSRFTESALATDPDTSATNGVLYKIDAVLVPSFVGLDLFDVLDETSNLSTLRDLVRLAGMEDIVRAGNLTVFAPVNAAFGALSDADLAFLTDPANRAQLQNLLLYHVVNDLIPATDLGPSPITTVLGPIVNVTGDQDGTLLNGRSRVLSVDQVASNGIVHLIGSILVPPELDSSLLEQPTPDESTSEGQGGKRVIGRLVDRIRKRIPGR